MEALKTLKYIFIRFCLAIQYNLILQGAWQFSA